MTDPESWTNFHSNEGALPADTDLLLVGAGIMSATLGTLLQLLAPGLRVAIVDALAEPSRESSGARNNAGTGHAALCELNYAPQNKDGSTAIDRAIEINEQFQHSRQFWATLVGLGLVSKPAHFHPLIFTFEFCLRRGGNRFLRLRHQALIESSLFASMQYSSDWAARPGEHTLHLPRGKRRGAAAASKVSHPPRLAATEGFP